MTDPASVVRAWVVPSAGPSPLRAVLGRELGVEPDLVPLTTGSGGKPRLEPAAGMADLRFNLSHSGELAIVALAEGFDVGVDIERVTPKRGADYLRDWCRREAYVKGTGTGLGGGFRALRFEPAGANRWRVFDGAAPAPGWTVIDLDVGDGYVAALAAESEADVSVSLDASLAQRA